jgi:hypothetical protein
MSARTTPLTYNVAFGTPIKYNIVWNAAQQITSAVTMILPTSPIYSAVPLKILQEHIYNVGTLTENANGCIGTGTTFHNDSNKCFNLIVKESKLNNTGTCTSVWDDTITYTFTN